MYIHLHFLVVNERSSEWYLVLSFPKIVQEGCKSYVLHFYPSGGLIDGHPNSLAMHHAPLSAAKRNRDHPATSAKTRIFETQISTNRIDFPNPKRFWGKPSDSILQTLIDL